MTPALEGIRLLDSAHQYPGPYCSMLLGDLGAQVIKIERPKIGDPARHLPGFFRSINRSKKSLTLDLKAPGAVDILYRLVETADVFTEGFRPGVARRLGIDYETLGKINPGLVYCSISGYGQEGPYRDLPGHDLNYMARAGMLEAFKDGRGNYVRPGVAIGDLSSGMFAALGILAALFAREKTGRGQWVDVSMFDGLLSWMSTRLGTFFDTGRAERVYDPGYGIYYDEGGRAFTLGIAHEDWFWDRLCLAAGLDQYKGIPAQERRDRREELAGRLQAVFSKKSREEWIKTLEEADVPVAPVQEPGQVVNDPQVIFREMIREVSLGSGEKNRQVGFPLKLSRTPGRIQGPPPELGEHTDQVLLEAGYTKEEIQGFKAKGAV